MKTCSTCNNDLQYRKVLRKTTGPFCTRLFKQEEYCAYCEWKGTTGPGAVLKAIAKKVNQS